jgi:hypothetical protein
MTSKLITAVVTTGVYHGKNTFHPVDLDARGGVVLCGKARNKVVGRRRNVPPCK